MRKYTGLISPEYLHRYCSTTEVDRYLLLLHPGGQCGGIHLDCGELAELAKRAATRGDRAQTNTALRAVLVWGSGQDGVDGRPAND